MGEERREFESPSDAVRYALERMSKGEFAVAVPVLRLALQADDSHPEWQLHLGRALEGSGRLDDALRAYTQAAEQLDEPCPAQTMAAACAARMGLHDLCLEWAQAASRSDSTHDPAWALQVHALNAMERFEEAEVTYYTAQEYASQLPLTAIEMGDVCQRTSDYARAAWCYEHAQSLGSEMPGLRTRLGFALQFSDEHRKALRVFRAVCAASPMPRPDTAGSGEDDSGAPYIGLGLVLESLGRLDEAEEAFKVASMHGEFQADAARRRGFALMRLARYADARSSFERSLAMEPGDTVALAGLAEAAIRLGDAGGARFALQSVVARTRETGSTTALDEHPSTGYVVLAELALGLGARKLAFDLAFVGRDPKDASELCSQPQVARLIGYLAAVEHDDPRAALLALSRDRHCATSAFNAAVASLRRGDLRLASACIGRLRTISPDHHALSTLRVHLVWHRAVRAVRALLGRTEHHDSSPRRGATGC
jgi:tetratricopeptide (TPR) repeat protein